MILLSSFITFLSSFKFRLLPSKLLNIGCLGVILFLIPFFCLLNFFIQFDAGYRQMNTYYLTINKSTLNIGDGQFLSKLLLFSIWIEWSILKEFSWVWIPFSIFCLNQHFSILRFYFYISRIFNGLWSKMLTIDSWWYLFGASDCFSFLFITR